MKIQFVPFSIYRSYFFISFCLFILILGCTSTPKGARLDLDGFYTPDQVNQFGKNDQEVTDQNQEVLQDQGIIDQTVDLFVRDQEINPDQDPLDQEIQPDLSPIELPDGEVPMGGARCDPRLRARECNQGEMCIPLPSGRIYEGRCVVGDGCSLLDTPNGCPEDRPYCHLFGKGTQCTTTSALQEGDVCLDEFNRSRPCADGLVCNFSTCVSSLFIALCEKQ